MNISPVPAENVQFFWADVEPYLYNAVVLVNESTTDEILHNILSGYYVLWIVYDEDVGVTGAAVTSMVKYPHNVSLVIDYLGTNAGVMEDNADKFMKVLQSWAFDNGCTTVEVHGRKGWGRALKKYGGRIKKYVYELPAEKAEVY